MDTSICVNKEDEDENVIVKYDGREFQAVNNYCNCTSMTSSAAPGRLRREQHEETGSFEPQDTLWVACYYKSVRRCIRRNPGDVKDSPLARLLSEWPDRRCKEYKKVHTLLYAKATMRQVAANLAFSAGKKYI